MIKNSDYIKSKRESQEITLNNMQNDNIQKHNKSNEIIDKVYTLGRLYKQSGDLVLEIKRSKKESNRIPTQFLISVDDTNELRYNVSYINSSDSLVKEKSKKIQKPHIIERIDEEHLLIHIFDKNFKVTDIQYETLIDYLNTKRVPKSEADNSDIQIKASNDNICDIMSDVLVELKSINRKLSLVIGSGNTSLEDINKSLGILSEQLD